MGALTVYAIGFAAFFPSVITNDDEAAYLEQTMILVEGRTTLPKLDPLTGELKPYRTDYYPVGTALVMAPFVAFCDWRGAYLAPLLGLLLGVPLVARWLHEEGRSPLFSLLILGFPATLIMARVGMSDVPSLAVVALGLWVFWRGLDHGWHWWLVSGFVAGASMLFRDTNAVAFMPLFAGTVLRREKQCVALIVGGLLGVTLKLVLSHLLLGDALYSRSEYIPDLRTLGDRLWIYVLGLTVFVPGGLVFALAYRGRRWPEVRASVLLFLLFFSIQKHATFASDLSRRLILDLRYMIPILPIIVFGMAESLPRLWKQLARAVDSPRRRWLTASARGVLWLWLVSILGSSLLVHYQFARFSVTQAAIRDAIEEHTGQDSVLVTNMLTTRKFIRNLQRPFLYVDRDAVGAGDVADLAGRHGAIFVVLLDRTDTSYRRADAERNAAFVDSLESALTPELDQKISPTERLHIYRVTESLAAGASEDQQHLKDLQLD